MILVADTNIFLAVAMNEPAKQKIIRISEGYDVYSPEILPYEIGNALTAMVKRHYLSSERVETIFEEIQKIPVTLMKLNIQAALEIALEFNLYAYNAYFLNCAQALNCPLLTLDKRMKAVAKELNIKVL